VLRRAQVGGTATALKKGGKIEDRLRWNGGGAGARMNSNKKHKSKPLANIPTRCNKDKRTRAQGVTRKQANIRSVFGRGGRVGDDKLGKIPSARKTNSDQTGKKGKPAVGRSKQLGGGRRFDKENKKKKPEILKTRGGKMGKCGMAEGKKTLCASLQKKRDP